MSKKEIPFNYFYLEFQNKSTIKNLNINFDGIVDLSLDLIDYDLHEISDSKIKIKNYNNILEEICLEYIKLSDIPLDIVPKNLWELVLLTLELSKTSKSEYKNSFLMSLQFIYQSYFATLKMGYPTLYSTNDNTLPRLEIIYDSMFKSINFDVVNIGLLEEDILLTKFLMMQINNEFGPLPNIVSKIRKYKK